MARLSNGTATVPLGETFAWVTDPDLGLTAQLTPYGEPVPLAVKSLSTSELVVRGPAGSDARFDYLVSGLRIGFEEHPVLQVKDREAPLPERQAFEVKLRAEPKARASTALDRFTEMNAAVRDTNPGALDPEHPGWLHRADRTGDPGVVGVAAAASETLDDVASAPVIGAGFAEVRVDAGYGEIRPGDLLTTSPSPGQAMRALDPQTGSVIGKALEPVAGGTATIRILVVPR